MVRLISIPRRATPRVRDHVATASEPAIYHPTSVFRELLNRSARVRKTTGAVLVESSPGPVMARRAPGLLSVLGVAFLLGVASGFLELAVLKTQAHVWQSVGWHSLMVSQHITWMLPAIAPLVIVPLAVILVWPALALLARRSRRGRLAPHLAVAWAWGWAGTVLGMLVLLGPLLAIRALHPAAAVALALGLGFRLGRGMVRPIGVRRRLCYSGAGILILALPVCLFTQWNAGARTPQPIASRPFAGSANLLWIVLDTLRADHMSLYGYGRQTTPQLEAWAKRGNHLRYGALGRVLDITFARDHVHRALAVRARRADRPSLQWACSDPGRASACPWLSDGRHRGQRQDVQHRLWRGAWVRRLPRLPLQPGDQPESDDVQLGAGKGGDGAGPANVAADPRAGPLRLAAPAREITAEGHAWLDGVYQGSPGETPGSRRPFFLFLNFMDVHDPYLPAPEAVHHFRAGPVPSKAYASAGGGWNALRARDQRRLSNAHNASGNWTMSAAGSRICTTNAFMAWTPSSAASSASYAPRAAWQIPGSSSPPTMGNTSASMACSAMGPACTTSRLMFPSSSFPRLVPKRPALTVRRGSVVAGLRLPSRIATCPGR